MQSRRFSPVVLACATAISMLSLQAQAQTSSLGLMNNSSLANGMTPKGARSYELPKSVRQTGSLSGKDNTPTVEVGTNVNGEGANGNNGQGSNGANGANGNNVASVGTGGVNNPSAAGGGASGGGSGGSGGAGSGGSGGAFAGQGNDDFMGPPRPDNGFVGPIQPGNDFMGPIQVMPGVVTNAGTTGIPGMASNGASTFDWIKMVQVAAPVVGAITGNDKIAAAGNIIGSGAQIYGQVSSGQELNMQNYANMGNIALQTAALATDNKKIDQAAQLGGLATTGWNAYSMMSQNSAGSTAAGQSNLSLTPNGTQPAGYTASGQPVYQNATPATVTTSAPTWGAVANIASVAAPQLGAITGNQQLGQVGALAGVAGTMYNQTNGLTNTPTFGQVANVMGGQGYGQVGQVMNAAGQMGQVVAPQTFNPGQGAYVPVVRPPMVTVPKPVYDNVTGEQVLPGSPEYTAAVSAPKPTQAEIDRFNGPMYAQTKPLALDTLLPREPNSGGVSTPIDTSAIDAWLK